MSVTERSFADVLRDAIKNIQSIVRAEVRLAKAEIAEEAGKAKSAAIYAAIGAVSGIFALLFLLLAIMFGLSAMMPMWAAAMIPAVALAVAAAIALSGAMKRFRQFRPSLDRTVDELKENVEWIQARNK